MSMKQQFRNSEGCCICGTKSSTSRFVSISDYEEYFSSCFGVECRHRNGVICNACVLCVKRHKANPNNVKFHDVLNSRRGPGPKNMKQINKRKKRKEQLEAAIARTRNGCVSSYCSYGANLESSGAAGSAPMAFWTASAVERYGASAATACCTLPLIVNAKGAVLRSATAAAAAVAANSVCHEMSDEFGAVDALLDNESGKSKTSFRVPAPPGQVYSPTATSTSTTRCYYKKRVIMRPIKMPYSEEIDQLYQEVRKRKGNLDASFDMPEIHHAMMTQKRRLLMGSDGSSVSSSTDSFSSMC